MKQDQNQSKCYSESMTSAKNSEVIRADEKLYLLSFNRYFVRFDPNHFACKICSTIGGNVALNENL